MSQIKKNKKKLSQKKVESVKGGKAKTADKAFTAMDGYIRG